MQCKARSKRSGEQCRNYAVKGCTVCRMHGARGGRPIIHGKYSRPKGLAHAFWMGARENLTRAVGKIIFKHTSDLMAVLDRVLEAREAGKDEEATEWYLRACVEMSRLSFDIACMVLAWIDTDPHAWLALHRKRTKKELRLAEELKRAEQERRQRAV